jgi:hypothetical protein
LITARNQTSASCRSGDRSPLAICRPSKACPDVVFRQFGKITQDLFVCLARGQPAEYITDGDPHVADARAAATHAGSIE